MENLQVINEQEVLGKKFRIYGDFDNPLFLASDVANWIEHSRASEMLKTVDENEKLMQTIFASGQRRDMWFLTEDGLYEVLMLSRKPIAKEFKTKVKEILKSVRKTGGFVAENRAIDFVNNWLPSLDEISKNAIALSISSTCSSQNFNPNVYKVISPLFKASEDNCSHCLVTSNSCSKVASSISKQSL